jgi:hypothetical protein
MPTDGGGAVRPRKAPEKDSGQEFGVKDRRRTMRRPAIRYSQFHNRLYHGGVGSGAGAARGGLFGLVLLGGAFVFELDGGALATTCLGGAFDFARACCCAD